MLQGAGLPTHGYYGYNQIALVTNRTEPLVEVTLIRRQLWRVFPDLLIFSLSFP